MINTGDLATKNDVEQAIKRQLADHLQVQNSHLEKIERTLAFLMALQIGVVVFVMVTAALTVLYVDYVAEVYLSHV